MKIPTIREDLLKFHSEYYSSNIMNLVMVGRHSIEDLEKLAAENFSDVEDKDIKLKDFSSEEVYDENSYGHLFKVVPNKNIKSLRMLWNLPPSKEMWREKPNSYIAHILGHEGPHSLLSQIIREGLATALNSSSSNRM